MARPSAPQVMKDCPTHGHAVHSVVANGRGRLLTRCMACHRDRERVPSKIRKREKNSHG